ncbi:MAG: glycosyltransferase [Chitinophagales bacterium]|nr:glycosyltransferase [Chitinophagales bacterium]
MAASRNVLLVTCWYPTAQRPTLGIFIQEMARAIHQAGNRLMVCALVTESGSWWPKQHVRLFLDPAGFPVHLITVSWRFHKALHQLLPVLNRMFRKYVRRSILPVFRPDVIHAHVIYPAGILGSGLAQEVRVPFVLSEHWSRAATCIKNGRWSPAARRALDAAAGLTVVSQFLKNELVSVWPAAANAQVVPNVTDTAIFSFSPKKKNDDAIRLLAAASWAYPKLPHLLIGAVRLWQQRVGRPLLLTLVGEGPALKPLKQVVQEHRLPVRFLGYVDKPTLAALMHQHDFFVHASAYETFGQVVAEALCSGTPVIASDLPPLRELVDESCGVLTPNTTEAWLEALQKAAESVFRMEDWAARWAVRLSPTAVGARFTEVYQQATDCWPYDAADQPSGRPAPFA